MEDQHGPSPPITTTAYVQMRPMAPSPAYSQVVQLPKKAPYHHPQQHWIKTSNNHQQQQSMPSQAHHYPTGQQPFVLSPDLQHTQQHSPLVHHMEQQIIASSPSQESELRQQQIGHHKGHIMQQTPRMLQNYQVHTPQQQQQFHRQRQVEMFQPGPVSQQHIIPRNMSHHSVQDSPIHQGYSDPEMGMGPSHSIASHQQSNFVQGLPNHPPVGIPIPMVAHQQQQQQQPGVRLIRQTSSLSHTHPAPPPPPSPHQQRILVHHQSPLMPLADPPPMPPPPTAAAPVPVAVHPSPYIGSQSFAMSILADMESQNTSPKKKYRDLKKKFKCLVYENEYYQEELRNLQRKLLKLSRDKNFLLDRLGQYENLSESSDDSDASSKTLDDKGGQKQKRKPKPVPGPGRKRAAPNTSGSNPGTAKRSSSGAKGGGGTGKKKGSASVELEKEALSHGGMSQKSTAEEQLLSPKQEGTKQELNEESKPVQMEEQKMEADFMENKAVPETNLLEEQPKSSASH